MAVKIHTGALLITILAGIALGVVIALVINFAGLSGNLVAPITGAVVGGFGSVIYRHYASKPQTPAT